MKRLTLLQSVLSMIVTVLTVLFVFPQIPGITVTSTPGEAVLFVIVEFIFMWVAMMVWIFGFAGFFIVRSVKKGSGKSLMWLVETGEKIGYFGFVALAAIAMIALRTVTLGMAAAVFSSVAIDGVVAAICASAALHVISFVFSAITQPQNVGPAKFNQSLEELRAKARSADAEQGTDAPAAPTEATPAAPTDTTPPAPPAAPTDDNRNA